MKPRRGAPGSSGGPSQSQLFREWIGGRLSPPFFIHDREEPYRPDIVIWVELPEGLIVGQDVVVPEDSDGAVARTLRGAMTQPLVGSPRRPDLIRVADAATAAEVRGEVGEALPVRVAPTPELDELLEHMIASMPASAEEEPSYFAWGHVSPAAVQKLFTACVSLFALKPWTVAADIQVIRMDIPALDVDGACISVIGSLDECRGAVVFPSAEAFDRYLEAAASGAIEAGSIQTGTETLALTFERATELPPAMRREAMEHGWPVASPDAYPLVERRDPDGTPRPLVERDVEIATACALALAGFFARHAAVFESDVPVPTSESYFDDGDREVRLTVPYEALADFDLAAPGDPQMDTEVDPSQPAEPFRPRVGRNEPCPCGSGRKYKKCHLAEDEAEHARSRDVTAIHALDERLVLRLTQFALDEFEAPWQAFEDDFADPAAASQLAWPWSVYGFEADGETVADAYRDVHGQRCSREELRWLDAQRAAWLSVWEVEAVDPGKTLTLHDLLSGERRTVRETRGSQTLTPRLALLGRIVDHDGVALMCGTHPRPLAPFDAAEVVRRARGHLRRRRAVPVDRLRDASFGRYLIRRWEDAVDHSDARSAIPPDLRNHDGEPLLLTVDHFEVAPGTRKAIDKGLCGIEGARRDHPAGDASTYVFLRPDNPTLPDGEGTVVGRAELAAATLRVETNSQARADSLRERIEAACGSSIRHRAREHTDPIAALKNRSEMPPPPPASSEQEDAVAAFKTRHYAAWADRPLPALNNRTPRECMATAADRRQVDLLLKDMEHREHRGAGKPFDFSTIRRDLGLG